MIEAQTKLQSSDLTLVDRARAGVSPLWLRRLSVTAFRSYPQIAIDCRSEPVVLWGANGAGKTNLLEALSLFAPGRGLRGASLSEFAHRTGCGAAGWSVAAEVVTGDGMRSLGTGVTTPAAEKERRVMRIDGAAARGQAAFAAILRIVWLTPQMDSLFRDSSSARRRFLDRLVASFDPEHVSRSYAYDHALRERARLLKAGGADSNWLAALEETMAGHGIAMVAARRDLVARLNQAAAAGVGPFPAAGLAMACEVEAWLAEAPALAVEDRLRASLAQSRGRDAESGGAAVGPHRADLLARHLDKDMPAALCSTGEQKALLIAIVLAHARLIALQEGQAPLLLLDEVAAHLDEDRREALFTELFALGGQFWMTGTERAAFASLADRAQFFEVTEGRVTSG